MLYFNQFLHKFSKLILITFKRIEANYLYVYQANFALKFQSYELFFTCDMKPHETKKASDNPTK